MLNYIQSGVHEVSKQTKACSDGNLTTYNFVSYFVEKSMVLVCVGCPENVCWLERRFSLAIAIDVAIWRGMCFLGVDNTKLF